MAIVGWILYVVVDDKGAVPLHVGLIGTMRVDGTG